MLRNTAEMARPGRAMTTTTMRTAITNDRRPGRRYRRTADEDEIPASRRMRMGDEVGDARDSEVIGGGDRTSETGGLGLTRAAAAVAWEVMKIQRCRAFPGLSHCRYLHV